MQTMSRLFRGRRLLTRRARHRTFIAGILAIMTALAVPSAAQAATGDTYASAGYGFAGADWTWSGPGQASNITLIVADWACDANPVYAYFLVIRSNGGAWTTDTRRYDYSGCDLGDNTTYTGLSISDGYNIAYLKLYICVRNGGCTLGGASQRNPLA
jgi:hypothetical protein